MRLVIAQCQVDYAGRLTAHLPMAKRLILVKSDGSVSIHADDRAYKPLNWMSPPCTLTVTMPDEQAPGGDGPDAAADAATPDGALADQVVLEPEALAHRDEVPVEHSDGTTAAGTTGSGHPGAAPADADPGRGEPPSAPQPDGGPTITQVWQVRGRDGDTLQISLGEVYLDTEHDLGVDPGLQKDGVEAHLQALLAENPGTFGEGWTLVRREHPTAIGPVDILLRDHTGRYVAVEVKRRGEIDGVEQLTRYLELLNRDPRLAPVSGVFAAQQIKPQARVLAGDRGITCVTVDYDALRGMDNAEDRLF